MAIVTAISRSLADRVALRKAMVPLRLAQFREGGLAPPGQPAPAARWPRGLVADQCDFFGSRPATEPRTLARSLWDLDAWAVKAERLRGELDTAVGLKDGFVVTAEVLRHLLIDPCLPAELLPRRWPGTAYANATPNSALSMPGSFASIARANQAALPV
jgi:phenylacetic acid degradation operon negative regulatory protein